MPPATIFQYVALNLLGEPVAVFRCPGNDGEDLLFALGLARISIKMADYEGNANAFPADVAKALKKGYETLIQTYKARRDKTPSPPLQTFSQALSARCPIIT